jgi:hypothetical protein
MSIISDALRAMMFSWPWWKIMVQQALCQFKEDMYRRYSQRRTLFRRRNYWICILYRGYLQNLLTNLTLLHCSPYQSAERLGMLVASCMPYPYNLQDRG